MQHKTIDLPFSSISVISALLVTETRSKANPRADKQSPSERPGVNFCLSLVFLKGGHPFFLGNSAAFKNTNLCITSKQRARQEGKVATALSHSSIMQCCNAAVRKKHLSESPYTCYLSVLWLLDFFLCSVYTTCIIKGKSNKC